VQAEPRDATLHKVALEVLLQELIFDWFLRDKTQEELYRQWNKNIKSLKWGKGQLYLNRRKEDSV
jgi:hypothetical protein